MYAPILATGENHLHLGKQVCRLYKILWCRCVASAAIQPRRLVVRSTKSPPERSNPLSGENLIHQVRELRQNPQGHALFPSALGTSFLVR